MHPSVLALFAVDVDSHILGVGGSAVGKFDAFQVGRENVVGFSGGDALGEFAVVVGVDLPADFLGLVGGAADFDLHSVERAVIRTPDGSGNKRVGLLVLGRGTEKSRAEAKQEYKQQESRARHPDIILAG